MLRSIFALTLRLLITLLTHLFLQELIREWMPNLPAKLYHASEVKNRPLEVMLTRTLVALAEGRAALDPEGTEAARAAGVSARILKKPLTRAQAHELMNEGIVFLAHLLNLCE